MLLKTIYSIFFTFIIAGCLSDDNNSVLSTRDRTLMENRLLGKWKWIGSYTTDELKFNDDLTFEGNKDNNRYSGTFTAAADSVLYLHIPASTTGEILEQYLSYEIKEITKALLKLDNAGQLITYNKIN